MEVTKTPVKIEKMDADKAKEEYEKAPSRKTGQWIQLLKDIKESKEGARVTGLTRGSAYSLARQAKEKGFLARTTDKGTTVIIAQKPAEKPKK